MVHCERITETEEDYNTWKVTRVALGRMDWISDPLRTVTHNVFVSPQVRLISFELFHLYTYSNHRATGSDAFRAAPFMRELIGDRNRNRRIHTDAMSVHDVGLNEVDGMEAHGALDGQHPNVPVQVVVASRGGGVTNVSVYSAHFAGIRGRLGCGHACDRPGCRFANVKSGSNAWQVLFCQQFYRDNEIGDSGPPQRLRILVQFTGLG